jgi:hypothetical protein
MHYDVLVIFNPPVSNLREAVAERMQPFKIEEDEPKPRALSRWDWYSLPADGPFTDPEVQRSASGFDVPSRVCRMSHLPPDYGVSAVITPEGIWHDLEGCGWRLVDEDSLRNKEALGKWEDRFREIVAQHQEAIGVEVHCHG